MLLDKLNAPERQSHADNPGSPLVGPPLYGSTHARELRVETEEPATSAQPPWFRELNSDPRDRIVAGLGTRVVQAEQEDLMAAAWNQVHGIEAANRALRLAQLARHVSASLHRRHLSRFTVAAMLAATERVHPKVLDEPGRSVWATLGASSLPATVTSGAFRRLARARGPIARAATPTERDELTVSADRFTRDWVARYVAPDGIRALSTAALARLTPEVAAAVDPTVDRDELVARWQASFEHPMPSDLLTPEVFDRIAPEPVRLGPAIVAALVARLARTAPSVADMADGPQAAAAGLAHALPLIEMVSAAEDLGVRKLMLPAADADRLQLEVQSQARGVGQVRIGPDTLRAYVWRAREFAEAWDVTESEIHSASQAAVRLRELFDDSIEIDSARMARALREIATHAVVSDPFPAPSRGRVDTRTLELVAKLDPARTVSARVTARLRTGSGRFPNWLRPNWFDDLLVEPVMAHPRFAHPMYEPLHRYDRDWMVPGLQLIERPDMATLLQTNNRFVEAYLVGLNHEMARELLWREFPTDQRGTYFSSFWTGSPELVADLHEPAWHGGGLGSHVDPALDGRLVFLVRGDLIRRYPGVIAHAAREAGSDRGIPTFEAASPIKTLFHVHLTPNVLLVGFAMNRARLDTSGEKWWFTLSENPTEPRFGLDPGREGNMTRDNLVWNDFGVAAPGRFLDATRHTDIAFANCRWGTDSAQVASLLFQLPARAAFSAQRMVAGAVQP